MDTENQSGWEYKPDGGAAAASDNSDDSEPNRTRPSSSTKNVSWQAPEFIEHHHGAGWYAALILVTAGLAAIIYLASSHDLIATVIVLILGAIVGVFASYKPRDAKYEVGTSGLKVNDKVYKYGDYKSFSIIREGQLSSLNMVPLKRLMPPVSAYFDPASEKKIMEAVGNYLPYEDRELDAIERLARRLRL